MVAPEGRIIETQEDRGLAKQSRHPYKIRSDGTYGNLQIRVPRLGENKILVVKGVGVFLILEEKG